MSRKCQFSGVARQNGHRVSHAKNRTKHVFKANLQSKKIFVPELGRTLRVKLSTRVIRTIDKLGFDGAMKKFGLSVQDLV